MAVIEVLWHPTHLKIKNEHLGLVPHNIQNSWENLLEDGMVIELPAKFEVFILREIGYHLQSLIFFFRHAGNNDSGHRCKISVVRLAEENSL